MFTLASRAWVLLASLIWSRMNKVIPALPVTTGAGGGGRVTVYFTITWNIWCRELFQTNLDLRDWLFLLLHIRAGVETLPVKQVGWCLGVGVFKGLLKWVSRLCLVWATVSPFPTPRIGSGDLAESYNMQACQSFLSFSSNWRWASEQTQKFPLELLQLGSKCIVRKFWQWGFLGLLIRILANILPFPPEKFHIEILFINSSSYPTHPSVSQSVEVFRCCHWAIPSLYALFAQCSAIFK